MSAAEVFNDASGEVTVRKAFSLVRDEQVARGLIDPYPEALISYTKTLEMIRRIDAQTTEALRKCVRPRRTMNLPRTVFSGRMMAYVNGVIETFSDPLLGDMARLTLNVKCESSEQVIVLCEWSPESLSFASGLCEVMRSQQRPFSESKAKLFCVRLALEIAEELADHLSEPEGAFTRIFQRITDTKRVEIARRAGLLGPVPAHVLPREAIAA